MNVLHAGRELDALVAEKVMGMRSAGDDPGLQYGIEGPMWRDAEERYAFQRLPDFSTDIAAAWQIVEHLTKGPDGWLFKLNTHVNGWHAAFGSQHTATAKTAPLAICHAALAATADR